jgi:hypothetical protein
VTTIIAATQAHKAALPEARAATVAAAAVDAPDNKRPGTSIRRLSTDPI